MLAKLHREYYGMSERHANGPHLSVFTPLYNPPSLAWSGFGDFSVNTECRRMPVFTEKQHNSNKTKPKQKGNSSVPAEGFILMVSEHNAAIQP